MTEEFQAVVDAQRKDDLAQLAEKDRELKNKDRELSDKNKELSDKNKELNIKDKEIKDRTNLLTQILSLAQTKRVSLEDIVQSCGTELAPFISALPNSQQPASAP